MTGERESRPPGGADVAATSAASTTPSLTALLRAGSDGERGALDAAFGRVYDELHRLAHKVRRGRSGDTLDTTALVHEAYLKLLPSAGMSWQDRRHFFAVAARAMRQVLVGAARERLARKRGGGELAVTFNEGEHAIVGRAEELIALDDALERLRAMDERQARIVELRFFAGLSVEETAAALALSAPTVARDWRAARAWLARDIAGDHD